MIEEERINRSFSDQVSAQRAEINRLASELNQRHVDDATSAIKGLELLAGLAAAGNPAAKVAIKTLLDALDHARSALAGLVVVKS